jgi:aryl-alcohol dehydrogenase-like predicted oxidoreductase
VSPQIITLAWELAKAPRVIPIPGASRPGSIRDSAQAVLVTLSNDDMATLDAA